MQLYSPPRLSEPFPHDLRVMIACVVEKDMDEDQHRIERLDRIQKPDRRGGVDGFDLDHSGLTGLEIDRAMDVDALAPIRFHSQQFFMRQSSQRKLLLSIHFVVFWRALAHADGAIVLSQLEMLAKWPIRSPYVISDFRIVSRPPFEMKEAAI